MKNVDHTVIALKHHYERYGRDIRVPDVFTEGNVPDPLVANFAIADEHGRLLLSKANFAPAQVFDREYFRVHQPRDSGQLFIGTPIKGRVSGKSFIPVSRRINKPDGSFAGVAMVGTDTAYFTSFYQRVDVGREGLIMLAGVDGVPRVMREGDAYRLSDMQSGIGFFDGSTDVPIANIQTQATGDGLPRFVSYRALDEYPLMVAIGSSQTEALAGFNRRADAYHASAAVVTALLIAVALILLAAQLRNRRTMHNMVVSEARFRAIFEQATAGIARSDVQLRILEVNQRFCDMIGYTEAELLGKSFDDITHAADIAKSHGFREALLTEKHGSPCELEKRYITRTARSCGSRSRPVSYAMPAMPIIS